MQALAAAGERIRRQTDVSHQVPYSRGDLAQLFHLDALAGVQVEHQSGGRPRLPVDEPPLRDMDLECGLLGDPRESLDRVDDRVGRSARPVGDGAAIQPVRSGRRQLLFEERGLVDTVRPALAGDRPARDVRDHRVGDVDVVVEHFGLGAYPWPGTAPCPGWSASPDRIDPPPQGITRRSVEP